jgi:hypothetical protein
MSNNFPFEIPNTGYAYHSLEYRSKQRSTEAVAMESVYRQTIQSSSITTSGNLWQQELARLSSSNNSVAVQWQDALEAEKDDVPDQALQKKRAAIQLLNSWREDDEQEQKETLEYLQRVLDEDRLSDRKLFP